FGIGTLAAYVRGSGQVHRKALEIGERAMIERALVGGAQHHARRLARLERLLPARCAQAPAVARLEAAEAELRHRRRQIVAARFGEREKSGGGGGAPQWDARPVLQQPSRKNPVIGSIEQMSSGSPSTLRGVGPLPSP